MKSKPLMLFFVVLIILLGISTYRFFNTHEYKEVTKFTPFKGEARENPLFAARLFLKRMGIPAENKNDLQSIGNQYPDTSTVIILDTKRSTLSLERIEDLLDWVRKGGHLITAASIDWELNRFYDEDDEEQNDEQSYTKQCPEDEPNCMYSRDPLQRVLDIHTGKSIYLARDDDDEDDSDSDDETEEEITSVFGFSNFKDYRTLPIKLPHATKQLELSLNPHFYSLESKAMNETRIQLQEGTFLIQRDVGKGLVTLVSELDIIENQLLRESDNAEIFWHLIHSHMHPSAVWLFHNDEMPNLFTLIWRHGWAVVLALTALLLTWLYQASQRFGPVIHKQEIARRRLMEHVEASGQFYWKENRRNELVANTRQALNKRIAQRYPGWHNSSDTEQLEHLSELLDLTPEHIKHLLFGNAFTSDEDFTTLISELETIRKSI